MGRSWQPQKVMQRLAYLLELEYSQHQGNLLGFFRFASYEQSANAQGFCLLVSLARRQNLNLNW